MKKQASAKNPRLSVKGLPIPLDSRKTLIGAVLFLGLGIVCYLSYAAWLDWDQSHCRGTQSISKSGDTITTVFSNKYYSFAYITTPDNRWVQSSGDPKFGRGDDCNLTNYPSNWLFRPAAALLMPDWLQFFFLDHFPPAAPRQFANVTISVRGSSADNIDALQVQAQKGAEFNAKTLNGPDKPKYSFSRGTVNGVDGLITDYQFDSENHGNHIHSTLKVFSALKNGKQIDVEWSIFGKTAQDRDEALAKYEPELQEIVNSVNLK